MSYAKVPKSEIICEFEEVEKRYRMVGFLKRKGKGIDWGPDRVISTELWMWFSGLHK